LIIIFGNGNKYKVVALDAKKTPNIFQNKIKISFNVDFMALEKGISKYFG
jgi:hypothetical protein